MDDRIHILRIMKISYKSYALNGEVTADSRIEFREKNTFRLYPIYSKFSQVDLDWYTDYNLIDFTFKKYKITNDVLFQEGEIKKGRWSNTLGEELTFFEGNEKFLDLEGVKYICKTGGRTEILYETISICPNRIFNYIDKDQIMHLPISTYKQTGRIDKDFPIVGMRKYIQPIAQVTFRINKIEY